MDILKHISGLEEKAKKFGFHWDNAEQIISQIQSECFEIQNELNNTNKNVLQEEIGDLLHATMSLCHFLNINVEDTLNKCADKFEHRFNRVVQLCNEDGLKNLKNVKFRQKMEFWDKAKISK